MNYESIHKNQEARVKNKESQGRFFKGFVLVLLLNSIFLLPRLALADLPPGNPITLGDIDSIVNAIADFMIVTSMICAVIFIVLSGIMIMFAQANPGKFTNGLLRLKHAIIGAGVVLATGVILGTVMSLVDGSFFCGFSILGVCLYP